MKERGGTKRKRGGKGGVSKKVGGEKDGNVILQF